MTNAPNTRNVKGKAMFRITAFIKSPGYILTRELLTEIVSLGAVVAAIYSVSNGEQLLAILWLMIVVMFREKT